MLVFIKYSLWYFQKYFGQNYKRSSMRMLGKTMQDCPERIRGEDPEEKSPESPARNFVGEWTTNDERLNPTDRVIRNQFSLSNFSTPLYLIGPKRKCVLTDLKYQVNMYWAISSVLKLQWNPRSFKYKFHFKPCSLSCARWGEKERQEGTKRGKW